nr:xylulose kinase-1 [Tanacetum cinerariifolium]
MEYWITNNDMNIWKVIQNGNSLKRTRRGSDEGLIILPSTTAEEHLAVQRESKARTTLLQSIPDDHIADFHYMDDAKDIWNAVKARFGRNVESKKMRKSMLKQEFSEFRISETDGFHKGYDRMQKILSQLNQLNAKPDTKEINLRFLRALPSSWSQVALTLKTKYGLEFLSFDDLYYKLKTLEVDVKGYSTFSPSQSAGPSHSAFVNATSTNKKMSYGDSPTHSSTATYSVPSKSKTGSYRTGNKARRKIDFNKKESAKFNKQKVRCYKCQQRGHFARECRSKGGNDKQRYSSFKVKEIGKKEKDSKALITIDTLVDWSIHDSESDEVIAAKEFGMIAGCDSADAIKAGANKLYNLINGANSKEANTPGDAREFALMGVTSRPEELGWDDSAFSVFTTTSKDMEGIPTFYRFAKTDSMKVVPPPLTGDYTSLSDHTDLDESQMSYGTKSSTSNDFESVTNDFVSCDDSDKSSEVNKNDLASSDSGLKSSEHKPTDSTSCASTFSVSTSVDEAEFESKVRTPVKDPIIAGHFKKYSSSVSKLCFVCGSGTHLIKDCNFYEKQMTTTTVGIRVGPAVRPQTVPTGTPKVKPVPTGKPKAKPVPTGRPKGTPVPTGDPKATPVPIGKPKGTPVPTGKPKFTPVPTGRLHRPFPVATDRGCTPTIPSGWWLVSGFRPFLLRQAKRNEKPETISITGVAKSYPGSFPQRSLNALLGIKRI